MGANVNLTMLVRPNLSTVAFGIGLLMALFAWLRSDPEYVSVNRHDVQKSVPYSADATSTH